MYHLAQGYWVYDDMLTAMRNSGWVRFAPGFKAGLYGKPKCDYCIKVLGMGVGENPHYFCERGYYHDHERRMLDRFRSGGFGFGPAVLPVEEAIRLLVDQGNTMPESAYAASSSSNRSSAHSGSAGKCRRSELKRRDRARTPFKPLKLVSARADPPRHLPRGCCENAP